MFRIGHGYDTHRFTTHGKPLILAGISIPFELGIEAHSDGDVVIHAVCDALLGAAALGDIGQHFPDTSSEYEGMDSRILLQRVMNLIAEKKIFHRKFRHYYFSATTQARCLFNTDAAGVSHCDEHCSGTSECESNHY